MALDSSQFLDLMKIAHLSLKKQVRPVNAITPLINFDKNNQILFAQDSKKFGEQ